MSKEDTEAKIESIKFKDSYGSHIIISLVNESHPEMIVESIKEITRKLTGGSLVAFVEKEEE